MFSFKKMTFAKKLLVFAGCLCVLNIIGIGVLVFHGMSSGAVEEFLDQYGFLFSDKEYLGWEEEKRKTIKDATEAIKKDPGNAKAYARRGKAYYWLSKYDKALKDYNKAISINGSNDEWYSLRAYVRKYLDDEIGALKDYSTAIHLNSKNSDYYKDRAEVFNELGQRDKALNDYKLAVKYAKNPASVLINRAEFLESTGKVDEAIKDLTRAIKTADKYDRTDAIRNRVDLYKKAKKYQKAIDDCSLWIKAEPDSNYAYENRAEIYELMKLQDKAKKDWNRAIKIVTEEIKGDEDGGSAYDYKNRAEYYTKLGKTKEAQKDLKKALTAYLAKKDFDQYDFETAVDMNKLILDKDYGKKAFKNYAERVSNLIKYDDKNPKLYYQLANTYEQLGMLDAAKSNWKNAIDAQQETKTDTKLSKSRIEDIYKKLDDKAGLRRVTLESIKEIKKKLEYAPESHSFYHSLGIAYLKIDEFDSAEDAFSKAIKHTGKKDHYLWHRAVVRIKLKKYDLAINDLKKSIELSPKDSSSYCAYAKALVLKGNYKDAIAMADRAIEISKDSGEAFHWRARAHQKLGEDKLAKIDNETAKRLQYDESDENVY